MIIWLLSDYDVSKYFAFNSFISRFSRLHPEVKIELKIKNRENMWKSFFNSLKDPKNYPPADIAEIPHTWTSIFAKLGLFMEVGHIFENFEPGEYPEFVKEGIFLDGTNYAFSVPLWLEIMTFQYRADMLKPVLKNRDVNFLSWEDFVSLCAEVGARNKRKDFYPLDNFNFSGAVSADEVLMCVLNRTDGYFSADSGNSGIMKDEVVAGVEDFLGLAAKKHMPLFQENFYEMGFLKAGLSAMAFSWRMPYEAGRERLCAAQFPQIRRKTNIGRSFNLAVSSSTERLEECRNFMKWLYTPENADYLCKTFRVFRPKKKDLTATLAGPRFKVYEDIYPSLRLTPNFPVYPTFEILFNNLLFESCLDIEKGGYSREALVKRLAVLKGEVDYLLSIY